MDEIIRVLGENNCQGGGVMTDSAIKKPPELLTFAEMRDELTNIAEANSEIIPQLISFALKIKESRAIQKQAIAEEVVL